MALPRLAQSVRAPVLASPAGHVHVSGSAITWAAYGFPARTYSMPAPVLSVCWACFDTHGRVDLCVLHEGGLAVVALTGRFLRVHLPCAMARLHPLPRGVLLEAAKARNTPTHYSLLHPLDDVRPLSFSSLGDDPNSTLHEHVLPEELHVSDTALQLVWTSEQAPYSLWYNERTQLHSLFLMYHARRSSALLSYETACVVAEEEDLRVWSTWACATADEAALKRTYKLDKRPHTPRDHNESMRAHVDEALGHVTSDLFLGRVWTEHAPSPKATRCFLTMDAAMLLLCLLDGRGCLRAVSLTSQPALVHTWEAPVLDALPLASLGVARVSFDGHTVNIAQAMAVLVKGQTSHLLLYSGKELVCEFLVELPSYVGDEEHAMAERPRLLGDSFSPLVQGRDGVLSTPCHATPNMPQPISSPDAMDIVTPSPPTRRSASKAPWASSNIDVSPPTFKSPLRSSPPRSAHALFGRHGSPRFTPALGDTSPILAQGRLGDVASPYGEPVRRFRPSSLPPSPPKFTLEREGIAALLHTTGSVIIARTTSDAAISVDLSLTSSCALTERLLAAWRTVLPVPTYHIFLINASKLGGIERPALERSVAVALTGAPLTAQRLVHRYSSLFSSSLTLATPLSTAPTLSVSKDAIASLVKCMHLVCEESKLFALSAHQSRWLAPLLFHTSVAHAWCEWVDYYMRHYGDECAAVVTLEPLTAPQRPPSLLPVDVAALVRAMTDNEIMVSEGDLLAPRPGAFQHPTDALRKVLRCVASCTGSGDAIHMQRAPPAVVPMHTADAPRTVHCTPLMSEGTDETTKPSHTSSAPMRALRVLVEEKVTHQSLAALTGATPAPILAFLADLRTSLSPGETLSREEADLVLRRDQARAEHRTWHGQASALGRLLTTESTLVAGKGGPGAAVARRAAAPNDGTELTSSTTMLLFSRDARVREAQRLLCSSRPVVVHVPAESAGDPTEAQQTRLRALILRSLTQPFGRALFTYSSVPSPTVEVALAEAIRVPSLATTGRLKGSAVTISLDVATLGKDPMLWSSFFNGLSAGLRIAPVKSEAVTQVTSAWISYHKPAVSDTLVVASHAGLLLGLGLQGHLQALEPAKLYDYLAAPLARSSTAAGSPAQALTTLALILGLACAYRATQDVRVYKLVSIHVPFLQHPNAQVDLDIPTVVQGVALVSLGLLHQGSGQIHLAERLLAELEKSPSRSEDKVSPFEREAHCICIGMSLGLTLLNVAKKSQLNGLAERLIEERLVRLIQGRQRRFAGPSAHLLVLEQEDAQMNVAAAAAVLALGLFHLQSGDARIAQQVAPPTTDYELDFVRPDLLLLRVVARSLILWDDVRPSQEWIAAVVPERLTAAEALWENSGPSGVVPASTVIQASLHVKTGAIFSLGLRFAGSQSQQASALIATHMKALMAHHVRAVGAGAHMLARLLAPPPMLAFCLATTAIALGMVLSGTGDLSALRLFKQLRSLMTGQAHGHCALSACATAIGLLFLGGGRHSLSVASPSAVAALLCSMYPRWPSSVSDPKGFTPALRALIALAVEQRCLECLDESTRRGVQLPIRIVARDAFGDGAVRTLDLTTPCLLPDFSRIVRIQVGGMDSGYLARELDLANPSHEACLRRGVLLMAPRLTRSSLEPQLPLTLHGDFIRSLCSILPASLLAHRLQRDQASSSVLSSRFQATFASWPTLSPFESPLIVLSRERARAKLATRKNDLAMIASLINVPVVVAEKLAEWIKKSAGKSLHSHAGHVVAALPPPHRITVGQAFDLADSLAQDTH